MRSMIENDFRSHTDVGGYCYVCNFSVGKSIYIFTLQQPNSWKEIFT